MKQAPMPLKSAKKKKKVFMIHQGNVHYIYLPDEHDHCLRPYTPERIRTRSAHGN